jgi:hypothetical protein
MAERDLWCREVSGQRWHFVRAGAAQGACGVAVNGHLWPHRPTAEDVSCRSCVRIAGAAGLDATQPPARDGLGCVVARRDDPEQWVER